MLNEGLVDKIEHCVESLGIFFDNNLRTLRHQIKGDMRYIKAICKLQEVNSKPYIDYFKQEIRDTYLK